MYFSLPALNSCSSPGCGAATKYAQLPTPETSAQGGVSLMAGCRQPSLYCAGVPWLKPTAAKTRRSGGLTASKVQYSNSDMASSRPGLVGCESSLAAIASLKSGHTAGSCAPGAPEVPAIPEAPELPDA